jgi:hypothetical protein
MADHHLIDIHKWAKRVIALSDALIHLRSPNDFRHRNQEHSASWLADPSRAHLCRRHRGNHAGANRSIHEAQR